MVETSDISPFRSPSSRSGTVPHTNDQVCFLLASGYFRATKGSTRRDLRTRDIEYAAATSAMNPRDIQPEPYDQQTILRHQRWILDAYGLTVRTKAERFLAGK